MNNTFINHSKLSDLYNAQADAKNPSDKTKTYDMSNNQKEIKTKPKTLSSNKIQIK